MIGDRVQEGEENFFEKKFSSPSCTTPTVQKTRNRKQIFKIPPNSVGGRRLDAPFIEKTLSPHPHLSF